MCVCFVVLLLLVVFCFFFFVEGEGSSHWFCGCGGFLCRSFLDFVCFGRGRGGVMFS